MSIRTGFARISKLIRWCAYLLLVAAFVLAVSNIASTRGSADGWVGVGLLAILGAIAFAISWVLDGFVQDRELPPSADSSVSQTISTSPAQGDSGGHPIKAKFNPVLLRWVTILVSALVGGAVIHNVSGSVGVGEYISLLLVILLITAAIAWIAGRRKPKDWQDSAGLKSGIAFAILAFLLAAKGYLDAGSKREAQLADVRATRSILETAADDQSALRQAHSPSEATAPRTSSSTQAPSYAAVDPKKPPGTSSTFGDEVTRVMREITEERHRLDMAYSKAVTVLGVEKWLAMETLLSSTERKRYAPLIPKAIAEVNDYERKLLSLIDQMLADAPRLDKLPGGSGYLDGVKRSHQKTKDLIKAMTSNERTIYATAGELYAFLEDPSVEYQVKDGRILFAEQRDLDRYQGYFARVQDLSAKSNELTAKAQSVQQDGINNMKALERSLEKGKR